jgi:hypothetical protein
MMKFVFATMAVLAGATSKVDYHLNTMVETMPPSLEMLQIQASMMSSSGIDVRDEIAALLYKMAKDIRAEEASEAANNRKVQNDCDKRFRRYRSVIRRYKAARARAIRRQKDFHSKQSVIPGQVKALEKKIGAIKIQIFSAERKIALDQQARDTARGAYLQGLADFNKALDDIDTLRTLVETGLSNRGQGANSNDVRYTQSPTSKKTVAAPTKVAGDNAVTHGKVDAGKFVEISSTEQLTSMNREEALATMKAIYSNLRRTSTNPMVLAVVDTLGSAMVELEEGNATDKIRSLLIQVRNELQKTKRESTQAENAAITAWQREKTSQRNAINDMKIQWQATYMQKAQLWKKYGDYFRAEGLEMFKVARYQSVEDRYQIYLDFETVICADQDKDYKANSAKRHGQLTQINKALKLLEKFGLGGKYGKMVRESIKDVTAGLCRVFDDYSKFVSVDSAITSLKNRRPTTTFAAFKKDWQVYNSSRTDLCISKIQYTVTCYSKCDIRLHDKRLAASGARGIDAHWPSIAKINSGFGKRRTITLRLKQPMTWAKTRDMNFVPKSSKDAKRSDVSVYVIPDCNCRKNLPDSHKVTADQSKTAKTDAKQAAESK